MASAEKIHFVHKVVYDENVPSTASEAARETGREKPLRGRTFISELPLRNQDFDPRVWDGNFVPTLILTDRIPAHSRLEWESADPLLFHASRLNGSHQQAYLDLISNRRGVVVQRFEPDLFRLRGDRLILVRQTFKRLGPAEALSYRAIGDGVYEATTTSPNRADATGSSAHSLSILCPSRLQYVRRQRTRLP